MYEQYTDYLGDICWQWITPNIPINQMKLYQCIMDLPIASNLTQLIWVSQIYGVTAESVVNSKLMRIFASNSFRISFLHR